MRGSTRSLRGPVQDLETALDHEQGDSAGHSVPEESAFSDYIALALPLWFRQGVIVKHTCQNVKVA
jgi:hypothetical protein